MCSESSGLCQALQGTQTAEFLSSDHCVNNFHVQKPVDANAQPQGHRRLLAQPPGIFCCTFWCKSPGVPGGDGNQSN